MKNLSPFSFLMLLALKFNLRLLQAQEPTKLAIRGFGVDKRDISFSLENYQRHKNKGRLSGLVDIRLSLFDIDSEKVFEHIRTLEPAKKKTSFTLNFKSLRSGEYRIVIRAHDRVAQESDVFSGPIRFHPE